MAYCELNGHVIDDATWPERSRSCPRYIWMPISWTAFDIALDKGQTPCS